MILRGRLLGGALLRGGPVMSISIGLPYGSEDMPYGPPNPPLYEPGLEK